MEDRSYLYPKLEESRFLPNSPNLIVPRSLYLLVLTSTYLVLKHTYTLTPIDSPRNKPYSVRIARILGLFPKHTLYHQLLDCV